MARLLFSLLYHTWIRLFILKKKILTCDYPKKKEKTLSNFIETGLFSVGSNGLIDNTVKEKLYEEIEERLEDIISEGILRELVEF